MEQKRKRGGQPGNINALKHGFYSRALTPEEVEDLVEAGNGLEDEIQLMRAIIRRVAVMAKHQRSWDKLLELMGTMGAAGVRLAAMLRTQRVYFEMAGEKEIVNAFNTAVREFWQEVEEEEDGTELD